MDQLRPSRLWKQMPHERKLEAARAFWDDDESAEQHPEAVVAIAQQLKFRPRSAAALPVEKRTKYLAGLPAISDLLASRLLVSYHLNHQRPMMGRFLDLLGITHDNGLITQEEITRPEEARLVEAARTLRSEFDGADVDLYFATLAGQDPDTWGDLAGQISATA